MSITGFDDSELLRCHLFGGCAIIYKQELAESVISPSHQFCAIELKLANQVFLLINVYMPTDYYNSQSAQLLRDSIFGKLSGFICICPHDHLMVNGDGNTDFS